MRVRQAWFPLMIIVCAAVFETYAGAQVQPCVAGGVSGMIGIGGARPNLPFSGVVKTSFEHKLADGNAIHAITRTRYARDSAGRTMEESAIGCVRGADGQMHERLMVNLNDPVARTNMSWQVGADDQPKVVRVFHQAALRTANASQVKRPELTPAQVEQQQKMMKAAQAQQAQTRKETVTEDLGVKDFHGVSAKGSRTTRTIPAGEEGNDQALVVITETWMSKELGGVVMAVRDDPRSGRTVTEYEDITRGEPDPSLFAVPAGYTVQEQPQTGIIGGVVMGFSN
jgi:hypothetical protein